MATCRGSHGATRTPAAHTGTRSGRCQELPLQAHTWVLPAELVLCWCCAGHGLRGGAASPAVGLCPLPHICARCMWDSLCFPCERLANVIKLE